MATYFIMDDKNLNQIKAGAIAQISNSKNEKELADLEVKYLGRNGLLTSVLKSVKNFPLEKRKAAGIAANETKNVILAAINDKKSELKSKKINLLLNEEKIDITARLVKSESGRLHPLTMICRQIENIFEGMGFEIADGPEVETEYYNFDALNIPKDHPARDMWDTFWLSQSGIEIKNAKEKHSSRLLLRTHTSPVQIHFMEKNNPPFRVISPGRCFRYEATDASHEIQFHQAEGLMIDKHISMANLKSVLEIFFQKFFGEKIKIRIRPSFFPFVEPGVEVDVWWKNKWLEVAGAGMVHPNVLREVKINPNEWRGFAFGMGLERLAMLKYKINDIRLFFENDIRFLRQF